MARPVAAIFWLLCGASSVLAQAALKPACDDAGFAQVLQAAAPIEARAVWSDARRLWWPGMAGALAPGESFRLYHSAAGGLNAATGQRLAGHDGVIKLQPLPPDTTRDARYTYLGPALGLQVAAGDAARLRGWHRGQMLLVHESTTGDVLAATATQAAGALDALYAGAAEIGDLGVSVGRGATTFKLWAPTALNVALCLHESAGSKASAVLPLTRDATTGIWQLRHKADLTGHYYSYLVDVFVRGTGWVRNRVTDPYSVSLNADSRLSYVADLAAPALAPALWRDTPSPHARAAVPTDMVVYELHVRDFSIGDTSVRSAYRGKYLAFTEAASNGMKHLRALADAGLTDVHLLPVFDIASVPESGCVAPAIPSAAPDSEAQQAAVMAVAATDCFNWGYDPLHFNAPEGSYATNANDAATRIREFRQMVQALHRAGLRVGMDVVYNHTSASGQKAHSVLDRIVPGYYHRLNAKGEVETSTCCDNTATEQRMMGKLLTDSVLLWARHYGIDSFRFDLMGHQPRALMEQAKAKLKQEHGRNIHFIGEGWNYAEVENGKRFVQASQLSLNGSGIGTFSDRGRDAARGGHDASGEALFARQGWLNGLFHDPNAYSGTATRTQLLQAADMVRVGLAGSLRDYRMTTFDGQLRKLEDIAYNGQPAGYVSQPSEVVNYVDNHDNQTLFDINAYRLPRGTSSVERARVQILGAATTAFSQGVAYFHAGLDILRSKSLDRNSYDSGDWFNRLDWSYRDNGFGAGLPPKPDNGRDWAWMGPLLADASIKPRPTDIAWTRDAFRDLLRIRASSTLFRLRSAAEVQQRLTLHNLGPEQLPTVMAAHLDGRGLAGAAFSELVYFVSVDKAEQRIRVPALAGRGFRLHPVHLAAGAADQRPKDAARFDAATGEFIVPPRTAVAFVVN